MFHCRMTFNWAIPQLDNYEYNPMDSKYLTRAGGSFFQTIRAELTDAQYESVFGEAKLPTEEVELPGGGKEHGVTLEAVRAELERRLTLLRDRWEYTVLPAVENVPIPYKYRIDPPECTHTLLLHTLGSEDAVTLKDPRAGVEGQVCATLEFWEA